MKSNTGFKMSLLHHEDNPSDCSRVREILSQSDLICDLVQVDSNEGYFNALACDKFDVILSAYTLTSLNGFESLDFALERSPQSPYLILPEIQEELDAIEALRRGATDYVLKDNIIRLVPSIKRAVQEMKRRDQLQQAQTFHQMLESQLQQSRKLESIGRLAAGIAHEINTPTQFICTNLDFINEACRSISDFMDMMKALAEETPQDISERIDGALETMEWDYLAGELPLAINQSREGAERVTSIVQSLKVFSHPGSIEKELRDLNKIIETTVTIARNEWKYIADMDLNLDPSLPDIPLLADEMGQVLLNLLVNAADAIRETLGSNPDSEKGVITIRTKVVGGQLELRIQDTGAGIPERDQPYIFAPFYTTKEVGKGSGQGLAISHKIITEKHQGSIEFETKTGHGTTFIIKLPL